MGNISDEHEIIREEYEKALQEMPRKEFDKHYIMRTELIPYKNTNDDNNNTEDVQYMEVDKYYFIK
ncbi:MAG TPA: hypothetical protein GXZ90_08900 [Clostridiales bacterium]|nr:hypothetical protein [Clostridiales bacterium]